MYRYFLRLRFWLNSLFAMVFISVSLLYHMKAQYGWTTGTSLWSQSGMDTISSRVMSNNNDDQGNRNKAHSGGTNIHWVHGKGSFLERVALYQTTLTRVRSNFPIIVHNGGSLDGVKWISISTTEDVFFGKTIYSLQEILGIETVALRWLSPDNDTWLNLTHPQMLGSARRNQTRIRAPRLLDKRNVIVHQYYDGSTSDELCEKHQQVVRQTDNRPFVCNTKQSLPVDNGTPSAEKHTVPPYIFYIHLIPNAMVNGFGDVSTEKISILPEGCLMDYRARARTPPKYMNVGPLFEEVFVISQVKGNEYYHSMCEDTPRLAPYLDFLKAHPHIKIHVVPAKYSSASLEVVFNILGLDPARMVSGRIRAKLVYLPQGTMCTHAHPQSMQILSLKYRKYVVENFPQSTNRTSIVMIRRSGVRRLQHAAEIEESVRALAEKNGFHYELFADDPVPPFPEVIQMFNRAVMVVGPHGAGMTNTVFSDPGIILIEATCNKPTNNLVFAQLAYILGHKYHGVGPDDSDCRSGVTKLQARYIIPVLEMYMTELKNFQNSEH